MKKLQTKLQQLKDKNRYRSLSLPQGIDLTSNDYLGLSGHEDLREAASEFLCQGGAIGAGGSRLLRGHQDAFAALEDYAADYFAAPKALYFSSGFQANAAIFQALPSRHDVIVFDEFVHASARDGIQNSNAQHIKVQHNDVSAFEDALRRAGDMRKSDGQIWIAVESLYSMDGDAAPLEELYNLAAQYGAALIIDEAHATGALGENGKGLAYDLYKSSSCGLTTGSHANQKDPAIKSQDDSSVVGGRLPDNLIVLHTCGKAIGVAGGLVCASEAVIDYLINAARGFIYSTAPMPIQAHLVQASLALIASDEGAARRERLQALSEQAQGLFGGHGTHIVPIVIGDDERCVHVAEKLQQKGYDIRAIRPPTVPEGTARLRLSLSADLDPQTLDDFAADLKALTDAPLQKVS